MMDYWGGRGNEALAKLQKLRGTYDQSQFHGQADDLLRQVGTVDQLFKNGQALLQMQDVEEASEPLGEALELDKQLMGDVWERLPSFYRRNIQQDIAASALPRGKHWADREDRRRGCKIWKMGFQFYKGNTDLNKVVGFCSTQGAAGAAERGRVRGPPGRHGLRCSGGRARGEDRRGQGRDEVPVSGGRPPGRRQAPWTGEGRRAKARAWFRALRLPRPSSR